MEMTTLTFGHPILGIHSRKSLIEREILGVSILLSKRITVNPKRYYRAYPGSLVGPVGHLHEYMAF